MDGRDRATCRKSKKGTWKAFWDFLMNKTKQQIVLSPTLRDQKKKRRERGMQWGAGNGVFDFLEREGPPSLEIFGRSDRRNSSGKEGKSLYASRPTRGLRF